MFIILLITFFILKIKAPTLPNNDPEEEGMVKATNIGIVQSLVIIAVLSCLLAFPLPIFDTYYVLQSLISTFIKIACPLYFINSLPNLKNYAINQLKSWKSLLPSAQVAPYDIPE